ncbi:unnamed protein product [Closterium sp. NIES-65]|nr:unnamed protein product [Closterium sp. NIES-65]
MAAQNATGPNLKCLHPLRPFTYTSQRVLTTPLSPVRPPSPPPPLPPLPPSPLPFSALGLPHSLLGHAPGPSLQALHALFLRLCMNSQCLLNWVSHTLLGRPSRGSTHSAFAISRMASQTAPGLAPSDSRASAVGSGAGGRPTFARSDTFFLREMRTSELLGRAVVAPDNGYLLLWQQLILALSFYSAFITPLEFSFLPMLPPGLAIADGVVSIFFLSDLILTFFVAYKDQKTQRYVCDHWSIATRYFCLFFGLLSLLHTINQPPPYPPPAQLTPPQHPPSGHRIASRGWQLAGGEAGDNLLRWFLWTRVVRTRHIMNYFHRLQRDIHVSYFAVRVAKLIFIELYITHVAGCFFYFLATTYPPDEEGSTWIGSLTLGDLTYTNFREMDLYTRYFTSLYWSVITMATIGYGDVHPVNPREMVFAMAYISFDLVLSAYLVGNITAMVVKGSNTTRYREKMSALIKYMNRNHLPHSLRQQMRQVRWVGRSGADEAGERGGGGWECVCVWMGRSEEVSAMIKYMNRNHLPHFLRQQMRQVRGRGAGGWERAVSGGERAVSGGERAVSGGERAVSGGERAVGGGERVSLKKNAFSSFTPAAPASPLLQSGTTPATHAPHHPPMHRTTHPCTAPATHAPHQPPMHRTSHPCTAPATHAPHHPPMHRTSHPCTAPPTHAPHHPPACAAAVYDGAGGGGLGHSSYHALSPPTITTLHLSCPIHPCPHRDARLQFETEQVEEEVREEIEGLHTHHPQPPHHPSHTSRHPTHPPLATPAREAAHVRLQFEMEQVEEKHVRLQFETEQVEDEVMEEFPLSIRHKVARALYQRAVEACYLFDGCSGECINQIVARAVPEYYYPLEVLIQKNDAAEHMFIVCSGTVQEASCVYGEGTDDEHWATLTAGNVGREDLLCLRVAVYSWGCAEMCWDGMCWDGICWDVLGFLLLFHHGLASLPFLPCPVLFLTVIPSSPCFSLCTLLVSPCVSISLPSLSPFFLAPRTHYPDVWGGGAAVQHTAALHSHRQGAHPGEELCQVLRIDRQSLSLVTSLFIVDGRRMVDNLLQVGVDPCKPLNRWG